MKLEKIVEYLNEYLEINEISDTSWNGLQYQGKDEVKKIIFAVDAGKETFNKALSLKADMIVVHHGHFWSNLNPSIKGWSKDRLDILFKNDISLYASHLPLDRHQEVGNNAQLLRLLDAEIISDFFIHKGKNIGWIGELKKQKKLSEITELLNDKLKTDCKVLPFGNEIVKTVAVCSGGGGYSGFYEALQRGVDLYLTGDAVEVFYTAKDSGLNIIFAGHHATETVGLIALARVVEEEFSVDCEFIDLPTGL